MLTTYPACFFKEDTGYSVIFPDLNYLATCGENLEDALEMAVECLAGHLYTLGKDNQTAPKASSRDDIHLEQVAETLEISPAQGFVNLISVDVQAYAKAHFEKSVKKTLTIPSWMNERATAMGINFSQVLQDALMARIQSNP